MSNTTNLARKVAAFSITCAAAVSGDCLNVASARELPLGTQVQLCGVTVTCTTDLIDAQIFQDIFVQDDSGGLHVFGPRFAISELLTQTALGHTIDLSGFLENYNGMLELQPPFALVDHGLTGIPAPVHTIGLDWQDGSLAAESMEAEFAWIARVRFQDAGLLEGLRNYLATDDAGQTWLTLRVSTSAQDLVGMPIPTGFVNVRGMFNQYDPTPPYTDGYQMLLRDRADISPYLPGDANFNCATDLSDLAIVLAHFGAASGTAPADGDFDGDGDVDLSDLAVLLANFGAVCP